jgi:DNA-binding MarR family transcriptional regulator
MSDPHFGAAAVSDDPPRVDLAQLVVRAADCLRALLHEPTARAGLNETRFNVLDLLRRSASGSCSQSEIAARLLQSESNLSTLLDRMHQDGLISRTRSKTDRRRVAIGLTPLGQQALALADRKRGRASSEAIGALDDDQHTRFREALESLIRSLERRISDVAPKPTAVRSGDDRTAVGLGKNVELIADDCQRTTVN